ncbi:hypothetical protein [Spirosoma oryzicola]|uniref:hypothetical protein n=1 Tax=Spirosoma oryzicola TaxID=2898794 RepID=UPI001E476D70|nr:hypothetical protein [Spirosoma oryzicola]UHG93341.1 hypothetical protein LQ777_10655 [Spirosoma oryzicola]
MQLPEVFKEDRLERYRDHLMTDRPLEEKELAMFQKYFFAYSHLCDGLSERQVVKAIMAVGTYNLSQSQAYNIVRDCQEIFANAKSAKKDAKRNIYVTRMEELAAKLELDGEYEAAANVLQKAAKMQGLLEKNAEFTDPRLYLPKPNMIFTSDLAALDILKNEVEDGEAEVVE